MTTRQRILVVEGDNAIQAFLRMALTDDGYAVAIAADTPAALALARSFHPNLIVLDLLHPKQDGREIVQAYREALGQAIPIVAMSTDLDFSRMARTLGVAICLVKPFELGQLLNCVRQHIDGAPV